MILGKENQDNSLLRIFVKRMRVLEYQPKVSFSNIVLHFKAGLIYFILCFDEFDASLEEKYEGEED
jgi:hypothetical protein